MDKKLKELHNYVKEHDIDTALDGLLYIDIAYDDTAIVHTKIAKDILNHFSSSYVLERCNKLLINKGQSMKDKKFLYNLAFKDYSHDKNKASRNNQSNLNKYIKRHDVDTALCGLLYEFIICGNSNIMSTSIAKKILSHYSSNYIQKRCNKLRAEERKAKKGQKYIDSLIYGSHKSDNK